MSHESAPDGNGSARSLTGREHQVLRLIGHGYTAPEIAGTLSISPKTAMVHKNNIYAALGATNRFQAVLTGLDRGDLHPREVINGGVLLRLPRLERRKSLRLVLDAMRTNLGAHAKAEEVAARLYLSPRTVKNHQAAIVDVLDARIVPAVATYHLLFDATESSTAEAATQPPALEVPILASV